MDLGAGFGMHAIPLARAGARVIAIDSSEQLLGELGRLAGDLQVTIVHDDLLSFRAHVNGRADLILCMGDTITHLPEHTNVDFLIQEAAECLVPGGRFVMTVWGDVKKSPGGWMFTPFRWATDAKIQHQADMVALGRPGIGEAFLTERGFDVAERFEVPFVLEFADPETYARGLGATGPAYEAIQTLGEDEFLARMTAHAAAHVRDGLPLRGQIQLFGYIGTKR